jgi:hypothetical protein
MERPLRHRSQMCPTHRHLQRWEPSLRGIQLFHHVRCKLADDIFCDGGGVDDCECAVYVDIDSTDE